MSEASEARPAPPRRQWVPTVVATAVAASALVFWCLGAPRPVVTRLDTVAPRRLTNATSFPVRIEGRRLTRGMRLRLTGPETRTLSTVFLDRRHLAARIPAGLEAPPQAAMAIYDARLVDTAGQVVPGDQRLIVINDADFVDPYDLAVGPDGARLFVASPTTDQVLVVDRASGKVEAVPVCDGPRSLSPWVDASGAPRIVVACVHTRALWILDARAPLLSKPRAVPGPPRAQAVRVRGHLAYVPSDLDDAVHVIDLETGREVRRLPAGVHPRALAFTGDGRRLLVGNLGSDDVTDLTLDGPGAPTSIAPGPGVPILGGHTEPFARYVMGGKAPRDLVASPTLHVVFESSIGPDVGPNPKRMEVSMNGGVGVLDAATGRFLRHVSIRHGVPEGMALDDARGLLYVTDVARGRLVALDARALADGGAVARHAILATLPIPAPKWMPLIRPRADFGTKVRAGPQVMSGPRVVRLSADGRTAFVLSRFAGTITEVDVTGARDGKLTLRRQDPLPGMNTERERRAGEVVYATDLGDTRMSCDACHYEGRAEGLLFTKGRPMHIYRVPSLLGIADSPPYFTPAMFPSLSYTAKFVLGRNRFHHPDPLRREVMALALYQRTLVAPPNPYLGADGAPPASIRLPDGHLGDPWAGARIFEGPGGCTHCHPAPAFTTDDVAATRGRLYDVGTPIALGLRPRMQDLKRYPLPAPSLTGVWDVFPLLHSGAAGFSVVGQTVRATSPFALRRVLQMAAKSGKHGEVSGLTATERDDLLAFLMTL